MNLSHPIIMDNKKLRDNNPSIQEHFSACENELQMFPKEKGIISSDEYVEWINCPVCDEPDTKQWIVKWGGRYDECPQCSHIFVKNRLRNDVLLQMYKCSEADKKDREVQLNDFNTKYWRAVYEKYTTYLWEKYSKEDSILDIGCGSGQFLKYCSEQGAKNIYGLDVYNELHEQCGSFVPSENLFVVKSFEDSNLTQRFKMIFLWGVLEHLINPNDILEKCHEYLDENGTLFILVPNIHSRARHMLGAQTPTINPRQHINFFTKKSIEYLCHKQHFEVVAFEHELPIIDLMWPFVHDDEKIINDINIAKEGYYHIYILNKKTVTKNHGD